MQGPPVIKVFANLPAILQNTSAYAHTGLTTFEASCYTDPLGIEHLTGGLAESISYFGTQPNSHLRWVTKYDQVNALLDLPHNGHTRCRVSLNAEPITKRLEGGTASLENRLKALRKLALPRFQGGGAYPVGVVLAPIMPIADWKWHYLQLLNSLQEALNFTCDLTFELISHRFTPTSKEILSGWYPNSQLDMNEAERSKKITKFGGNKFVYPALQMKTLRGFFEREISHRFPNASILYWT